MKFISSKVSQKSFDIEFILLSRILRSLAGGIITIAFPYFLLKDLHYSPFLLGIIYTAATISTALLSLASGYVADLWNQKYTLILTLLLLPLSSLIILLSHNIIFIFLAAVLGGYTGTLAGGVTGGAAIPLMNALVSDIVSIQERVKVFSKLMFIGGISGAVGMLLGKISNTYTLFIFASVASLLSVMIMIPVKVKTKNKKANTALKAKGAIFKFSVVGILNGLSQGLIMPFMIPFFIIVYHTPKSQMSIYSFVGSIVAAFAPMFANLLDKRYGFLKSITVTRGLGAIMMVFFPMVRIFYLSLIIYLISPFLRMMALPIQQSTLVGMVDASETARALSINQVSRLSASAAGTFISSDFFLLNSIEAPFLLYGVVMFFNIYLYVKFFKNKKVIE
ncbi:MAG: MFS transporter [Desulfurella sp.]